jgi:hypothetical protein
MLSSLSKSLRLFGQAFPNAKAKEAPREHITLLTVTLFSSQSCVCCRARMPATAANATGLARCLRQRATAGRMVLDLIALRKGVPALFAHERRFYRINVWTVISRMHYETTCG